METGNFGDAISVLDELIAHSEASHEEYFVEDARFQKMFCLKHLGRESEIQETHAKISPGATAYIGDKLYHLDDFD
jgi:hypothetical protein